MQNQHTQTAGSGAVSINTARLITYTLLESKHKPSDSHQPLSAQTWVSSKAPWDITTLLSLPSNRSFSPLKIRSCPGREVTSPKKTSGMTPGLNPTESQVLRGSALPRKQPPKSVSSKPRCYNPFPKHAKFVLITRCYLSPAPTGRLFSSLSTLHGHKPSSD